MTDTGINLTGLANMGNTCFFNSVLQCLKNCLSCQDFSDKYWLKLKNGSLNNSDLVDWLSRLDANLDDGRQQDAHECYIALVNDLLISERQPIIPTVNIPEGLEQETRKLLIKSYDSYYKDGFRITDKPAPNGTNWYNSSVAGLTGQVHNRTVCGNCGNFTHIFQPFTSLVLNIHDDNLAGCIQDKCQIVNLENYQCDNCHSKGSAQHKMDLWYGPEILTIVLNRFENGLRMIKNSRDTNIPLDLDIAPFLTNNRKRTHYKLKGVVCHSGRTLTGGHYFSYCYYDRDWFRCNDSNITKIEGEPSINPGEVYMLFYSKC